MITQPFPRPGPLIERAAEALRRAEDEGSDGRRQPDELGDLPRPWNPDSCPDGLRLAVWQWCDDIAAWINHEFVWRPAEAIPACWLKHPGIARDLAVVGYLRWDAERSTDPGPLADWQRHSLPAFLSGIAAKLGESTCRTTGVHQEWPAAARYNTFTAEHHMPDRLIGKGPVPAGQTTQGFSHQRQCKGDPPATETY